MSDIWVSDFVVGCLNFSLLFQHHPTQSSTLYIGFSNELFGKGGLGLSTLCVCVSARVRFREGSPKKQERNPTTGTYRNFKKGRDTLPTEHPLTPGSASQTTIPTAARVSADPQDQPPQYKKHYQRQPEYPHKGSLTNQHTRQSPRTQKREASSGPSIRRPRGLPPKTQKKH